MRFFDTHAHLNDESFDTDRAALIEGLPSCGAELIMDVACAAEDFEKTLEITAEYPFIQPYGAFIIRPYVKAYFMVARRFYKVRSYGHEYCPYAKMPAAPRDGYAERCVVRGGGF